jgi:hypothetical protein
MQAGQILQAHAVCIQALLGRSKLVIQMVHDGYDSGHARTWSGGRKIAGYCHFEHGGCC